MTDIGELVVRIKADAAQLEREMRKAQGTVQSAAGGMNDSLKVLKAQFAALVPAISAVAFVDFGKRAVVAAGHIVDLADRIGFAAGTLAALEIPLDATGTSLDEFTGAINRMNNAIGEARKGNEATIKAFDALGLSVDKLAALSPEDQFYAISKALGQIKDQSIQTEAGMNIFGRTFAAMLPLLKQYEGDMQKAVDTQKDMNAGIEDSLKRVDEFGDAVAAAGIKARNSWIEVFATILKVKDAALAPFDKPASFGMAKVGYTPQQAEAMNRDRSFKDFLAKSKKHGFATEVTFAGEKYGPPMPDKSGKGTNQELLDRIQAAKDALKSAKENADATRDLGKATEELTEAQKEAIRFQSILHDKLSSSLTDIAFKAGSAREAMLGFAESIARAAFERKVAGPLADALIGTAGGKGLLDSFIPSFGGFFADGGRPPVGVPSIVGENGPEIFVPNSAGTIIPNGVGGTSVAVYQTFNMQPGLPETVGAAIRQAAPHIAAMAQAGLAQAAQMGGDISKTFGLRS